WAVLLADATRALASAGRWREAFAHVERHNGIGHRLLDGRQVAVLAHLHVEGPTTALSLLNESTQTEPWEEAVKACLTALCLTHTDQSPDSAVTALVDSYLLLPTDPALALFHVRLGVSAVDLAETTGQHAEAGRAATRLLHHAMTGENAYAAREILNNGPCRSRLTTTQHSTLSKAVRSAGLDHNTIPQALTNGLLTAVETAQAVAARDQQELPV
ncbi:hypothetical protein ACFQ07_20370, partial [Actinomadura adrarensis]